jgi:ubiquinone/menaquinone biosynthesis C-methylase UbiE
MEQEKVWDNISRKWQEFKVKPFKRAVDFIKNRKGKILDLGCGSGRNFTKTKATIYAVDFSEKMLKFSRKYAKELKIKIITKKANAYNLPFKDNFFDAAIFIATLHCIDSKEKRKNSLQELYRVLKPKAKAMITVWSRNEKRVKNKPKESMIPWTVNKKKYDRYTYIYEKDELKDLLEYVGFKVKKIKEDKNIIVVVEK